MSFFDQIFGSKPEELNPIWKKIENGDDLAEAIEHSKDIPVVIFKHSTRCIISKTVLKNFENKAEAMGNAVLEFYYLDLLNHRDISNKIAETFGITHQSPQVILIKGQKAIYHTSHDRISLQSIIKELN